MNYFEKKQWIRLGICAVLLIAASLFLTGIIGGEHMTYSLQPEIAGTLVEETMQGYHGPVTVHVTLDGKTVNALTVDTPDETDGLGKKASEEAFTSQFIGKEGPFTYGENGIDSISGATVTSRAVLRALNKAITGEDAEPEGTDATSGATDATSGATETAGSGSGADATSGATETAGSESGADATSGATEAAGSGSGADATSGATEPAGGESGTDATSGATENGTGAEDAAGAKETEGKTIPGSVVSRVVVTMGANSENNIVIDYLEKDPFLKNIYEGYGFAKDYGSARGHTYTLTDVSKTMRPHPKANCITCKSDDFSRMVNTEGIGVYSRPFDDVMPLMENTISCYTCHGDGMGADGKLAVTHSYVNTALGDSAAEIDPAILACGQCHIEYYFTPSDSETMMPYHSKAEMVPEAILAYYDSIGYYDWEQPGTGTLMLKAQHPEMETVLASSHYAKTGMTCADCHMPRETTEDGFEYSSHTFVSPLQNEALLASCAKCHGSTDNVIALVGDTQKKVTERETAVGNRLSTLKDMLAKAAEEGNLSEEKLAEVRKLHREAQWFFDFCYVENSEGAHNSALSMRCLETADSKIDEAMAILQPAE